MEDHALFPITYEINVPATSILKLLAQTKAASLSYNLNKTGILTTNSADYLGWEKTLQSYYANLSANAKADLATFPPTAQILNTSP